MRYTVLVMLALLSAQVFCYGQPKRSASPAPQKQPIGWRIGLSFGSVNNAVKMDFSDKPFWRYNYVGGWQYPGLEVHYALAPRVLATFGLNVLQRGQKVETIQKLENVYNFTLMRTYLNLPAGIAVELFDTKLSPYVNGGIYGAYWISGKWTGKVLRILGNPFEENYNNFEEISTIAFEAPYEFSSNSNTGIKENRVELGIWGGGGLSYRGKSGLRMFIGVNATGGLTHIYSTTTEIKDFQKRKNTAYIAQAGLTIPVRKNM